ncbi:hypothetical protein ACN28E_35740 [Archangium lansingense]|uniref:hypothetical protein n=1 Tax=Archangium lansingense TaxID=2995310 RepID=UPI003B80B198
MIRKLLGACGAVVVAVAWACNDSPEPARPEQEVDLEHPDAGPLPPDDAGTPPPDAGQTPEDGGTQDPPDAGIEPDGGTGTDGGTEPDGGSDGGPGPQTDPWPKEASVNYTQRFGVGSPQSVAVDDAFNIWLLAGNRIGVLRPGDSQPLWASSLGQAGRGFSSTVICGGSAGRAYVGYYAQELDNPLRSSYQDSAFLEGDLDAVKLTPEGTLVLEEHITRSFRRNRGQGDGSLTWNPPNNTGIRNSNDWRFDEDRAVLSCVKVMRGRDKGEVYIGTNHGVTRIRGLDYNSHRHPVWFEDGTQRAGFTYAVGIAQDGDVLMANDWTFGIVTPNEDLGLWDAMNPKVLNPMKVESSYLPEVNPLPEFDFWRGFQQTKDGRYYLASKDYGLWEMSILSRSNPWQKGTRVQGLPTQGLTALAATDDGSLFIGTAGSGLWRMDANKNLSRVANVPGRTVKQLIYDPNGTPAMLYVLTDSGLTVLRGY